MANMNLKAGNNITLEEDIENNDLYINGADQTPMNVEIIAISDDAPEECQENDKYYNSSDNKIYTATADNTWSEDGEELTRDIFYILLSEQEIYSYNGETLVSVGGSGADDLSYENNKLSLMQKGQKIGNEVEIVGGDSKDEVYIGEEEPTDPDNKIWIDTGEVGNLGSEITNEYSESTGVGYSANYINNNTLNIKNLYNKDGATENSTISGCTISSLSTGNRATLTVSATYAQSHIYISNVESLLGKTLTFSCNYNASGNNMPGVRLYWFSNGSYVGSPIFALVSEASSGKFETTFTMPDTMPDSSYQLGLLLYANLTTSGTSAGDYVDYTEIQLEIGDTATKYEPYANVENNDIYSSMETRIGTWIDGKKIYRKVIVTTSSTINTEKRTDISNLNVDNLIKLNGFIKPENLVLNINMAISSTNYIFSYFSTNTNTIRTTIMDSNYENKELVYILEYTKTTDEVGD